MNYPNIPKENIDALKIIVDKFKGKFISWTLIGSMSLAIQGVDVQAHDIDILTDIENADKIADVLKEFVIEPMHYKTSTQFKSYYGKFQVNGVQVEVLADLESIYNGEWTKTQKSRIKLIKRFEDMTLPLFELKDEYDAYIRMNRIEKANKILETIEKEKIVNRTSRAS
jgi:hypothetical protein